jgi:hypothetical protein
MPTPQEKNWLVGSASRLPQPLLQDVSYQLTYQIYLQSNSLGAVNQNS